MPVIDRFSGFRLLFYSNEGSPLEPPHIHALKDNTEAKFWLTPEAKLCENHGVSPKDLKKLLTLVQDKREEYINAYTRYFTD